MKLDQATRSDGQQEAERLRRELELQSAEVERLKQELGQWQSGGAIAWSRIKNIVDSMAEALILFRASGEVLLANAASRSMFAPEVGDMARHALTDYAARYQLLGPHGDPLPVDQWPAARALAGERVLGHEVLVRRRADGQLKAVQVNALPVRDATGAMTHAVLTFHDITKRHQAEQSLRRQMALDALLNRLLAALASATGSEMDGHIGRSLAEVGPIVGAERVHVLLHEPAGDTFSTRFGWCAAGIDAAAAGLEGTSIAATRAWVVQRLRAGEVVRINGLDDIPLEAAEHRRLFVEQGSGPALFVPMRGGGGRVRGALWLRGCRQADRWSDEDVAFLSMMSDAIASAFDRKHAEEALRESERRVRSIATATPTFLIEVDEDGRIRYINRVHEAFTERQILGTRLRDWVPPEMQPTVDELVALAYASGETQSREYVYTAPSGRVHTYLAQLGPYAEADGGARRALLTVTDISEWRRTSEALGQSQQRLVSLFDNAPIGIFHCTADGRLLRANPSLARMFGYESPQQLVGTAPDGGQPIPFAGSERERVLQEVLAGPEWADYDLRFLRRGGGSMDGRVTLRRVLGADGTLSYVEGFVEDTTERLRAEQERDQLFNLSVDMFCVSGLDGSLKQWNPAVERTLGWSKAELSATPFTAFFHPDDLGRLIDKLSQGVSRATLEDEYRFRCKDGSYRFISWSSYALPGENLVFSVGRDTTERRREEEARRQLETQFRQAQKMEGIGRLAGGIAHDFNNILAVILSYASFVRGAVKESDPAHSDVQEIEIAATRASDLTRQLLAFSRKSIVNPRIIDLNVTLAGLEKMLRRIVGEDISLVFDNAEGLWPVKLDPSSVDQIMLNLVVNARDAMPVGGRLVIETANADRAEAALRGEMPAGDYVKITVGDSGGGMTPAVLEHLFEPFFTTKKEGKGTGLGLATVYGIVKQSRGFIFVDSGVGRGSRFEIFFPRAPKSEQRMAWRPSTSPAAATAATVLVVDDEPALRRIAVRSLQVAGYTVIEADGGASALAKAAAFSGRIDLVLTDVIMPDMNGRQMVEHLRQARSGLTVLYMSGYTDDTIARHGVTEAEVHFIQKPFTPTSLVAAVASAVRAASRG